MSEPWSIRQLVAVRFVALFLVLQIPFLLWLLPYGMETSRAFADRVQGPIEWFGETVLGFNDVAVRETGSGDTAFDWSRTALSTLVAAAGAIGWTAMARKRRAERTLLSWIYVGLRYGLGLAMLQYGVVKVLPSQFTELEGDGLLLPYGDSSPMGLLWRYMGYSHAFNIFTGGVEILGGLLLLFRRTWLVGALVSAMAMVQVVAMNFAFDVPVKIFSSQLLTASLVLLLPFRHRLTAALFTDRSIDVGVVDKPPVPDFLRRFKSPVKAAALLICVGLMIDGAWQSYNDWGRGSNFELAGIYDVTEVDTTHATGETTVVSIDHVRSMSFWRIVGEESTLQRFSVELTGEALTLTGFSGTGLLDVSRPSDRTLILVGQIEGTEASFTLTKRPPPELLRRGFHWVSEYPYYR